MATTKVREVEIASVETTTITCGFCRGSGRDPFGIMSHLSTCGICGGTGTVSVRTPYTECAFCEGTGIYPSSRLSCTACGGLGVHTVGERTEACPNCHGPGVEPTSASGFYCLVCHGGGTVEGS